MVRIIVDSSADFEPHELQELNITCIPLTVMFGEDEYQENINLSKDEFYHLLQNHKDFPHTSRPSPYELGNILKEAKDSGDEAVAIILSSDLSGTIQDVIMAKEACGYDACHVVDSLNATGGTRIMAEYAVRLRDAGKSAAEIAEAVRRLRKRISLYACLDTLEYLRKGGRISSIAAAVGTMARVKPIISVGDRGNIEIPAKMLGMARGQLYLLERFKEHAPDPDHPIYVMYTHIRENAEKLADRLGRMGFEIPPERIINVGAAIGSHVGPNAVGIVYVRE